jgi:hypothetical protein
MFGLPAALSSGVALIVALRVRVAPAAPPLSRDLRVCRAPFSFRFAFLVAMRAIPAALPLACLRAPACSGA